MAERVPSGTYWKALNDMRPLRDTTPPPADSVNVITGAPLLNHSPVSACPIKMNDLSP